MKKIISAAVAVLLAAGICAVMTGCGGNNDSSSATTQPTTATATQATTAAAASSNTGSESEAQQSQAQQSQAQQSQSSQNSQSAQQSDNQNSADDSAAYYTITVFNTATGTTYSQNAGNADTVSSYFELPTGSYEIVVSKTVGNNVDQLASTKADIPDTAQTTAITVYYNTASNSVNYEIANSENNAG